MFGVSLCKGYWTISARSSSPPFGLIATSSTSVTMWSGSVSAVAPASAAATVVGAPGAAAGAGAAEPSGAVAVPDAPGAVATVLGAAVLACGTESPNLLELAEPLLVDCDVPEKDAG